MGGSFVACAMSFGNSAVATKGGIPTSSRFGRSLNSLAHAGVSECAMRLSDGSKGLRVPNPRVSHPADPEPSLTEQLGGLTMKTIKGLILGSAAAVVAMSGAAQAADLPIKAKAVEYVRVCSLYGAGF